MKHKRQFQLVSSSTTKKSKLLDSIALDVEPHAIRWLETQKDVCVGHDTPFFEENDVHVHFQRGPGNILRAFQRGPGNAPRTKLDEI